MIESLTSRIKSWAQTHMSPLKIDFMSLNRLRLNQTAESIFETNIPYTEQAKKGLLDVRAYLPDTTLTYDNPKVIVNPFGMAPLFAVIIFYTEENTRVSYRVKGHTDSADFSRDVSEYSQSHLIPVIGLYSGEANMVELTLYNETGKEIAKKDLVITTASVPYDMNLEDQCNYVAFKDAAGELRYYLNIRTAQTAMLPNSHLTIVENICMTPNYVSKAPTHFHELDYYGFTYRTYYIGTGIDSLAYQADNNRFYIQSHEHSIHEEDAILEMSATTGEIKKIHASSPVDPVVQEAISFEELASQLGEDTLDQFLERFTLPQDNFSVVGWLSGPKPHKGASSQTTDTITIEDLYTQYGVRIVLAGDAIHVTMHEHQVQEILFAKLDEIFQMDYSSYITKEEPTVPEAYTIAIPLSEIHSGTYSVIIRFVNGDQAIVADALRLSRARS